MRLWSLHPSYLDRQGLVACWREALLAKKVLEGKTKGYKNHPQLERFKNKPYQIDYYLTHLYLESLKRGYNFDVKKAGIVLDMYLKTKITVTKGQLEYEFRHLQEKLKKRCPDQFIYNMYSVQDENLNIKNLSVNITFTAIEGEIESWEKIKEKK